MRRDWRCPWVRKDGLGLKSNLVRAFAESEEQRVPVHTSQFHFYRLKDHD